MVVRSAEETLISWSRFEYPVETNSQMYVLQGFCDKILYEVVALFWDVFGHAST